MFTPERGIVNISKGGGVGENCLSTHPGYPPD